MRKDLEERYAHLAAEILHDRMSEGNGGNLIFLPPLAGPLNKSLLEEGWDTSPFEESSVRPGKFTNSFGEVLLVPMMEYVTDSYYEDHLFRGAVVPLGGRTGMSLVLLMPKDQNNDLFFLARAVDFSRIRRNLKKIPLSISVPVYEIGEDDLMLYLTQQQAREVQNFERDVNAYLAQGYAEDEAMPFIAEETDEVEIEFNRPFFFGMVCNETNLPSLIGVVNEPVEAQ